MEKVQGFGGVLLQRTASPLMVAFGLPQTLDQLPQRAVQTALAIRQLVAEAQAAAGQEPVPAVRQALHLGTLLVEGQAHERAVPSPLAGETQSVAVRLLGHAETGRGAGVTAARTAGHGLVCAASAHGASRWRTV